MSYLKEEERYVGCAVFLLWVDIKFIFLWVGPRPLNIVAVHTVACVDERISSPTIL